MDRSLLAWHPIPLKTHCACDRAKCEGDAVVIPTKFAREVYVRWDPVSDGEDLGTPGHQAQMFYSCLPRILEKAGAHMAHVVLERVFFRDLAADIASFEEARRTFFRQAGVSNDLMPLISCVEQPPCQSERAFEAQVYAVVPNSENSATIRNFPGDDARPAAKILEMGGFRHFLATGIDGRRSNGQLSTGFRDQSDTMFGRADELLSRHGIPFQNVLRTWCYLDDIDRDYAEFNLSRNAFFEKTEVSRLPASTGIRAGLHHGALCSVDLYALMDMEGAQVEIMCTPTLNEAPDYGSSFSRGMKLSLPEKTVLFISGTASVDEQGDTVHVDDLTKQVERMLLNVKELLAPHGASFADLAQVITYLKHASYLEPFLDVWKQTGPAEMPNSIVEAGVCRPDLLCEMEAIAVLPTP